jgi:hypothetical protein
VKLTWLASNLTEEAFIQYLFDGEPFGGNIPDTEVVIYSGIQREPSPELISLVNTPRRFRRILVHLSDEKLRHRNQVYSEFDVVLRNYFDPRLAWRRNVRFFPLGWTSAFGPQCSPSSDNPRHTWSFCGAIKADRAAMVREFEAVAGGFHHLTTAWNSDDQLPPQEVRRIYEDSTFVLCPQGNGHMDTFRVMEALQAGAIPVTTEFLGRDFFQYTFGKHPFVVARDWSDATRKVEQILEDSKQAIAYRRRVNQWYQGYLQHLTQAVREIVSAEPIGHQSFLNHPSQTSAKWDVSFLFSVWRRFRHYRH